MNAETHPQIESSPTLEEFTQKVFEINTRFETNTPHSIHGSIPPQSPRHEFLRMAFTTDNKSFLSAYESLKNTSETFMLVQFDIVEMELGGESNVWLVLNGAKYNAKAGKISCNMTNISPIVGHNLKKDDVETLKQEIHSYIVSSGLAVHPSDNQIVPVIYQTVNQDNMNMQADSIVFKNLIPGRFISGTEKYRKVEEIMIGIIHEGDIRTRESNRYKTVVTDNIAHRYTLDSNGNPDIALDLLMSGEEFINKELEIATRSISGSASSTVSVSVHRSDTNNPLYAKLGFSNSSKKNNETLAGMDTSKGASASIYPQENKSNGLGDSETIYHPPITIPDDGSYGLDTLEAVLSAPNFRIEDMANVLMAIGIPKELIPPAYFIQEPDAFMAAPMEEIHEIPTPEHPMPYTPMGLMMLLPETTHGSSKTSSTRASNYATTIFHTRMVSAVTGVVKEGFLQHTGVQSKTKTQQQDTRTLGKSEDIENPSLEHTRSSTYSRSERANELYERTPSAVSRDRKLGEPMHTIDTILRSSRANVPIGLRQKENDTTSRYSVHAHSSEPTHGVSATSQKLTTKTTPVAKTRDNRYREDKKIEIHVYEEETLGIFPIGIQSVVQQAHLDKQYPTKSPRRTTKEKAKKAIRYLTAHVDEESKFSEKQFSQLALLKAA